MSRAFTLVEMLLATLLVGLLTVVSLTTFRAVTRGWKVSTDHLDRMQRTEYALDQVVSGLRSMYYPHDGSQDARYGFALSNRGEGESPRRSDVIEWSKTGPAIVGTKSAVADTVHRVQVLVLEEGSDDYGGRIERTGLYARLCGDSAIVPKEDSDGHDLTLANAELHRPVLIAEDITGFNCRVLKTAEGDRIGAEKGEARNAKERFEDEFGESNAVPYRVELTFFAERPDGEFRSQTRRVPTVRTVRIPIYEQSLDGAKTPADGNGKGKGGK